MTGDQGLHDCGSFDQRLIHWPDRRPLTDRAANSRHRQEEADANAQAPCHDNSIQPSARQDLLLRCHDRVDEPLPAGAERVSASAARQRRFTGSCGGQLRAAARLADAGDGGMRQALQVLQAGAAHHSDAQPRVGSGRGLTVTEGDTWGLSQGNGLGRSAAGVRAGAGGRGTCSRARGCCGCAPCNSAGSWEPAAPRPAPRAARRARGRPGGVARAQLRVERKRRRCARSAPTHQPVPVMPGEGAALQEAEGDEAYSAQEGVEPQPAGVGGGQRRSACDRGSLPLSAASPRPRTHVVVSCSSLTRLLATVMLEKKPLASIVGTVRPSEARGAAGATDAASMAAAGHASAIRGTGARARRAGEACVAHFALCCSLAAAVAPGRERENRGREQTSDRQARGPGQRRGGTQSSSECAAPPR